MLVVVVDVLMVVVVGCGVVVVVVSDLVVVVVLMLDGVVVMMQALGVVDEVPFAHNWPLQQNAWSALHQEPAHAVPC